MKYSRSFRIASSFTRNSLIVLAYTACLEPYLSVHLYANVPLGLSIAKEKSEAENRVKQEQMEEKLSLQAKLLEEEKRRNVQDRMITAMSSDYRSVYYIDLDSNEGVCYRSDPKDNDQTKEGVKFPFHERFVWYAENTVDDSYREGFLNFIDPENIREGLSKEPILAYRYLAKRNGIEYYEMIRVAGVRKLEEREDHIVHAIGLILKNEEFSFSKMLESINTMFSGQCLEKNQNYSCNIKGQVDDYYIGDNMKLRQILINILGNAVKFTPEGGNISLDIQRIAQFDDRSTLQFTIRDNGIGMSEDFLPHIFDTFTQEDATSTNKYGSSGLGLAITKNIIEMMNGTIQVESKKGEGTTFTVSVTLNDSEHKDTVDEELKIHPGDMSVLIIDDDSIACEHAKLVLEQAGIDAEVASNGAEGVEMTKLRHVRHEPYNLILIDWKMPDMDGIETTRKIREIVGNESAIIILTAYKWDDILDEAVKAGVDSFIAKPLFASNVLEEFRTASIKKYSKTNVESVDLKGLRVLVAEDVDVNAEILQMILKSREIESDVAVNGKIAVDLFESNPENYYAAILMDVRMPEMDGLEATRHIRAMERPDAAVIPIIALTANAFDEDVQRSLQAGLNAHLTKPIQPEILFETLESLIRGRSDTGEGENI